MSRHRAADFRRADRSGSPYRVGVSPRPSVDEDDEPRRPWWALSVLTMVTVAVVTITVFLFDSPKHPQGIDRPVPTPSATAFPSTSTPTPGATHRATRTPTHRPTSSAVVSTSRAVAARVAPPPTVMRTSTAARPAGPCAGSSPCVVPGDGGVGSALNTARAQRGSPPVPVAVSGAAQQCAIALGCNGQYALQAERAQDGAAAVRDLLAESGSDWLLAPGTPAIGVGWAYSATYGYVVVLLRAG